MRRRFGFTLIELLVVIAILIGMTPSDLTSMGNVLFLANGNIPTYP
jgi:type II secretory pathway pseudopilin PulG